MRARSQVMASWHKEQDRATPRRPPFSLCLSLSRPLACVARGLWGPSTSLARHYARAHRPILAAQGGIHTLQHSPVWTARWDVFIPSLLKLTFGPAARQVQAQGNSRVWCYMPCLGSRLTFPAFVAGGRYHIRFSSQNHETGGTRPGSPGREVLELVVSTFSAPLFIPGRTCSCCMCFQFHPVQLIPCMEQRCVAEGWGWTLSR